MKLIGRAIVYGDVEGYAIKCDHPVVILGDVNEKEGTVCGKNITGKIFVFPKGVGSTVGSYTIYGLRYYDKAPLAMVLEEAETIVAAGAIIADIPTVDSVEISLIQDGDYLKIKGNIIEIISSRQHS